MQRFADIHPVDDAAEEHGLGELRRGQHKIREDEEDGDPAFAAEEAHRAEIELGQGHGLQSLSKASAKAYIN